MRNILIFLLACIFTSMLLNLSYSQENANTAQEDISARQETANVAAENTNAATEDVNVGVADEGAEEKLGSEEGLESKEEDIEYGFGEVVKIEKEAGKITINEYDYDTGEEINVTYSVDPKVELENIAAWADIPVGGYIGVEYKLENNEKVAKYITYYEEEAEEIE